MKASTPLALWSLVAVLYIMCKGVVGDAVCQRQRASRIPYEVRHFNQTLDHFSPVDHRYWSHRYLFSNEFWNKESKHALKNGCPGPILLYTGNEGPITAFWESNGFMIDHLAPKWGGFAGVS